MQEIVAKKAMRATKDGIDDGTTKRCHATNWRVVIDSICSQGLVPTIKELLPMLIGYVELQCSETLKTYKFIARMTVL